MKVLRDFLVNKGGYYVPCWRDLTNQFCRVNFIKDFFNFLECIVWEKEIT